MAPDTAAGEQHRRIRRTFQQWQQAARQNKGRGHVDMQDLLPCAHVIVLNGRHIAEQAGVVEQPIQPAIAVFDLVDQCLIVRPLRLE